MGMFLNQKTNVCDYCQVFGCEQCNQNQQCVKCSENLNFDQQQGCVLSKNICDQQQYYSVSSKQCSYQCSQNEITDQQSKLCVPIQNCNYFQETGNQIQFISSPILGLLNNGYLLQAASLCQFYLFDQNLNIINNKLLVTNPQIKTITYGPFNFFDARVGGCQTVQKTIAFNFLTNKIEFELTGELNIQYSLYSIQTEYNFIVLQKNYGGFIFYDYSKGEIIYKEEQLYFIQQFERLSISKQIFVFQFYKDLNEISQLSMNQHQLYIDTLLNPNSLRVINNQIVYTLYTNNQFYQISFQILDDKVQKRTVLSSIKQNYQLVINNDYRFQKVIQNNNSVLTLVSNSQIRFDLVNQLKFYLYNLQNYYVKRSYIRPILNIDQSYFNSCQIYIGFNLVLSNFQISVDQCKTIIKDILLGQLIFNQFDQCFTALYQSDVLYFQQQGLIFQRLTFSLYNIKNNTKVAEFYQLDQSQYSQLSFYNYQNQKLLFIDKNGTFFGFDIISLQKETYLSDQNIIVNQLLLAYTFIDSELGYTVASLNNSIFLIIKNQIIQQFSIATHQINNNSQLKIENLNQQLFCIVYQEQILIIINKEIRVFNQQLILIKLITIPFDYKTSINPFNIDNFLFFIGSGFLYRFDLVSLQTVVLPIGTLTQNVVKLFKKHNILIISQYVIQYNLFIILNTVDFDKSFKLLSNMDDLAYFMISDDELKVNKNIQNNPIISIVQTPDNYKLISYWFDENLQQSYTVDIKNRQIIKKNILKNKIEKIFNFQDTFTGIFVDPQNDIFIYQQDNGSLKLFNSGQVILLQQFSEISRMEVCFQQKVVIVQTSKNQIYINNYLGNNTGIFLDLSDILPLISLKYPLKFQIQCQNNLIFTESPYVKLFNLNDGSISPFQLTNYLDYRNFLGSSPIIDVQNKLIIYPHSQFSQYFQKGIQKIEQQLYSYASSFTEMYYDIQNNYLIVLIGNKNQITVVDYNQALQKYQYVTQSNFQKNLTCFIPQNNLIILIDQTPSIYTYYYLTNVTNIVPIQFNQIRQILPDIDNNFIYISTQQSVHAFKFPQISYYETLNDNLNENNSQINKLVLVKQINTLFVTKQIYFYNIYNQSLLFFDNLPQNFQQILIQNNNIVFQVNNLVISINLSSLNTIQINQLELSNTIISYMIKLSSDKTKQLDDRFEDINQSNYYDNTDENLVFIVQNQEKRIYIINTSILSIVNQANLDYQIINVVVDRNRKIIFCVSDISITYIYDFSLKLLSFIKNPCLVSAKIFFDEQLIYSVCPNSVYFYNSLTLAKQDYQINSGFNSIEYVKSFYSQNTFLLVEQDSIYIIKFEQSNNKSIQIVFKNNKQKIQIQSANIIVDNNNQKYFQIFGISWSNIVYYLIPYQPQQRCTSSLTSEMINLNSQQIQNIQQNANLSNQAVAQLQIQFQNNQQITKFMNLQKQNIQMQIVISTQNYNTLIWNDGSIADDPNIGELVIHDVTLNITNQLTLNQNNNINKLLLQNINLIQIQNQVVIQNLPKVIFSNITIESIASQQQNSQIALIIFKNCSEVIINNIKINNINLKNQTFFQFQNSTNLTLKNINVSSSVFSSLLNVSESEQVNLNQVTLNNITNYFQSIITAIIVQQTSISSLSLYQTNQNQIFSFQGCNNINLTQITVINAQEIILLKTHSYLKSLIYPINNLQIGQFNVSDSQNVNFVIEANQCQIFNSQFKNIQQTTTSLINSQLSNIEIIECYFYDINLSEGQSSLRLINFNNLLIKQSKFQGNIGNLIYLLNQNEGFLIEFNDLLLKDNSSEQQSNILINYAQNLLIKGSQFLNQVSQQNGGALNIQNTDNLIIADSRFQINQSVSGNGGSLYLYLIKDLQIIKCIFIQNQAQIQSGGAVYLDQSQLKTSNSSIINSNFQQNKAIYGLGGAIFIKNCDLNLVNTNILNNKASIGGGIYYQQMIPQIIQNNLIQFNKNQIKDNECILYGQNIGSTLRKIELELTSNHKFIVEKGDQQQPETILLKNFRSGDYLFIDDIQILDEENNYFKYNPLLNYSQSAVEIIQQTTLTINMQTKSEQMNIFGGIVVTFQKGKFSFNISLSYIPNQSSIFQIESQTIPYLYDSKGNLFLPQSKLSLNFKVEFRKCMIGEIQKEFFSSITCDQCPDGKYSLGINDQNCQICPSSAAFCQGSTIQVKNGFWRKNNQTDQILQCQNAPGNCKPQNLESKFGCAPGYIGPLCEQCDFLGDVWGQRYSANFQIFNCSKCSDVIILQGVQQVIFLVVLTLYIYVCNKKIIKSIERDLQNYYLKMMGLIYLNNSIYKANSTVYSKILIDHLQIISILSSLSFQFPTVIQVSANVGGNPLLIQNNIFDCFYPQKINIPKWFAKVICSMSLPFIIYLLNYCINICLKVFCKKNTHSRYQKTTMIFFYFYFYPSILLILTKSINCVNIGNEKYAQIDTLITCRDFSNHLIYNLFFSFPSIFLLCIAIPIFLIYQVRKNINQNLTKIQKSSYQFIYEPYKRQYYYWEFIRLSYKSAVMISSIILQDSLSLKTSIANIILIFYNYIQMRVNPFTNKLYNQLETQSILISVSTLNFCLIQTLLIDQFYIPIIILQFLIIILNINFIFKMLFLAFVRPIPAFRQNRNIIQQCLYYLKTKYPQLFAFIQIDYKIKFSTALKIKKLKSKLKSFIEIRNERLSTYQTNQKYPIQSLMLNQQKSPTNQFKISFFNQQYDYESIHSEFDNFKQASQPLTLQSRYQLSAKIKQQVELPSVRQDALEDSKKTAIVKQIYGQNCLSAGEIYDFVQQQCQKCNDHCNTCSGLTQNDCLTCKDNYFRYGVDNSCQQLCGLSMYLNNTTNTCDYCQVLGCDQCLQNQQCLKCTENFQLNAQARCVLKNNTCDGDKQYYSLFSKQCSYQCSKNEIKDQNNLCVPIQNCNYLQETQEKVLSNTISFSTFIDNGFLLIGESLCQFYLYNQNLEIVYSNLLVQNPKGRTITYGVGNFFDGNVGGCQTQQKIIGFNFLTYEIEFEINNQINTFYSIQQLNVESHSLLLQNNSGGFMFFDYLNNEQILIETNSYYIYQFDYIGSSQVFLYQYQNSSYVYQNAVLYFRKENKTIKFDQNFYNIEVINKQNMIFYAIDTNKQLAYFLQLDQGALSPKIILQVNNYSSSLYYYDEVLQLFIVYGDINQVVYYIQKDNIQPIYKIINDLNIIPSNVIFKQQKNTNQSSVIMSLQRNIIVAEQLNYQQYKETQMSSLIKDIFNIDIYLSSINLISINNQIMQVINNYNQVFFIELEINDLNLEKKKIYSSSKQSQEIILDSDYIKKLEIGDTSTSILVNFNQIQLDLLSQIKVRQFYLGNNMQLYCAKIENSQCQIVIKDFKLGQIIFNINDQCFSSFAAQDILYIQQLGYLFQRQPFTLYNVVKNSKVTEFYQFDLSYAKTVQFYNFQDKKLLFTDQKGQFFGFDLNSLQQELYINNSNTIVNSLLLANTFLDKNIGQIPATLNNSVYLIINNQYIQQFELASKIEICFQQQQLAVQTTTNQIFIFNYQSNNGIFLDVSDIQPLITSKYTLIFQIQCQNNIILTQSPYLKIFNLNDGSISSFQLADYLSYRNGLNSNPIIDVKSKLIIYPHSNFSKYYMKGDQVIEYQLYSYVAPYTEMYYDSQNNYLTVLVGSTNLITVVDYNQALQMYQYKTQSNFFKNLTCFIPQNSLIIIIDQTPQIYIYYYLKNVTNIVPIYQTQIIQILPDINNKFIYIITQQFVHAFTYPDMTYYEALNDRLNLNNTNINKTQLVSQINTLFVVRQDTVILAYDLIESIILQETSFINQIQLQYVQFNNFIVTYNLQTSSLLLFKDRVFQDEFLLDLTFFTLQKCDIFKIDETSLIFIAPYKIFEIQINLQLSKFQVQNILEIYQSFTDVLFDFMNKRLILVDQSTKEVFFYEINKNNLQSIGKLLSSYQQIIIQQNNLIYTFDNNIASNSLFDLTLGLNNQLKLGKTQISYMIKLSQDKSKQLDDRFEEINQSNYYDTSEENLVLVIQNQENIIYIVDTSQLNVTTFAKIDYQIVNVAIDRNRRIIFCVSNISYTYIYDFSLKLLSQIKNPCLLNTKIFFDNQLIYSVCPNSVYFYNSLTLAKQNYQISSGFNNIEYVKSLNSQNTFILTQKDSIYILQFQTNDISKINILFQKQKQNIFVQSASIVFDNNNQKYYQILGISWTDMIYYLIPYQPQDKCTANFVSQNSFMNSQKIQNIQLNAYLSNQTVAQVQIQFQNDQEIHKIMNLQKQNTQMQIVFYTQNYNTLVWSDGSIVDDSNIDELVIHDTVLNITNNLIVNQNNNINLLLFYNINIVGLQNQVVFENIPKIIFSNITIQSITSQQQQNLLALIIFKNCSKVILNNITINNVNIYNQTFFQFENISNLKINSINVSDSIFSSLIQITQALQLSLKQLTIQNITNQFQSIFIATTVQQTDISYLNISKTNQNQIFSLQGCYNINLSQVFVSDAQNIILLFTSPYQNVNIYPINNVKISNFDVSNSQNIGFIIQANQSSIFNSQFKNVNQTDTNLINSKLSSIEIIECNFQNINLSQGYQIIRLINYNNLIIEQSKFQGNLGNLMYLLNQNEGFAIVLNNLQLTDNISQQQSNILVNFAQKLIIKNSVFINQISQQSGGALNVQNTNQLNIIDSKFQINQSILGDGGSLYLYQIQNLYISSCQFLENQSQNESGGAVFIDQSQLKTTNSSIIKCNFQQNIAIQGLGGAIYIKNCDLNLENTNILNNRAAIGGGIYYKQMIPYIIQHDQIQLNGNIIKDNGCILYGQNIASTLKKIKFNFEKSQQIKIQEGSQYQSDVVVVQNFRSGDYLVLDDIQIIDEDSYNFKYNPLLKYSQSATEIIQQTTLSINMQKKNEKMNIFGGIIVTYQKGKFSFNISLSYIPNENSAFYIQSQTIPALYDSKGNIYLEEKQLSIIFNVEFRKCITGEVQKSFFSSIICDECPDGKYSLSINDQACQICPSQAVECFGSQINVKNGYWKKNNESDQILYCVNAPENCLPQSQKSKFGCAQGYIGPLCEQCDFFGNVWEERYSTTFKNFNCSKCSDILILAGFQQAIFVLILTFYIYICNRKVINSIERDLQNYYIKMMGLIYLNNSVYKTNSTVFSKILIDHIQLISILSSISFQFPTVIQFSSNVGGNPLLIQSSMFDCFYPQQISIPKWFAKVICSMSLPFVIYFLNYIINIFLKVFYKKNTHSRYKKTTMIFFYFYFYPSIIFILIKSINCVNIGNEKYAQIDTLISCRDFSDHFIYNLVFSFPAIFMACVAIPLFFIHKVRKNMRQNLSKIQKSSYQFIYEPYKNQYYYWEFVRLVYKTTVMISSIFLQEYLSLKTCIVNQILVLYNYIQMRVNPFAHQLHNQLENQSILISISTLNFCLVQSLISDEYYTIVILFQLAIILLNLYFVLKLVFLTFVKPISPNIQNRNIFQEYSKIKFQTALKIKKLRLQLKVLSENRERQSTLNIGQKQSQQSMVFNSQKIANQYKFQLVNQQTDYETVNTEFENCQQAQQALTLSSKYQLSAKIKNQVYGQNCLSTGEIYDFVQQQCQKCNDHCNTCSGLTQNDCLTCKDSYFRYGVDNSCQGQCGLSMYVNNTTNTCDYCQVLGCDQCLQNQQCLKCTENFQLNSQAGCVLNNNTCDDDQQYYSLFSKQCSYQCSKNEIKDQNNLCVPIQNCNYLQEKQTKVLFNSISFQTFLDNGFLLIGESLCQFYLYNQNLEIVYSNLLVQNPKDKTITSSDGNFFDGNVGGCQTQQKIIGFNFLTYQIEFEINNYINTLYSLHKLNADYLSYRNSLNSNPIIDVKSKLIIYPHSSFSQYYQKGAQTIEYQLYSYVAPYTKMYYDSQNNYLTVLVGSKNLITVVDYNQALQMYQYKTQSNFQKNLTCFIPQNSLIIIIDQTPQIYIYYYLQNVTNIVPIYQSQVIQILPDINNNFVYIITQQFVHAFTYPDMTYYEALNDRLNLNNTNINKTQLVSQINTLFVVRQDTVILAYDLIESIILQETSFINQIQLQYIQFNNFIVTYNLQTSSLLLFKDRVFQDEFLLDLTFFTLQKCDIFKIDETSLIFVAPYKIFEIQINLQLNKFEVQNILEIFQSFTDILFDFVNKRLILVDQQTKEVFFYEINKNNLQSIGKLQNSYSQIIIQQNNLIYTFDNNIVSNLLQGLTFGLNNQLKLGKTQISYMIKLSQDNSKQLDDRFEEINQSNYYDTSDESLVFIVQNEENMVYIINTSLLNVTSFVQIDYQIVNIVVDRNRRIIFCVSNISYTYIYDFSLKLLSQIKNPCLLNTKIFFDNQLIYSVCPNSVYFYNSLTLAKQNYQISSGFNNIEYVKSLNSQNTFILTQKDSIYILQFQSNDINKINILFQKQKQNIFVQSASIVFDNNNKKYYQILGMSWTDIIDYLIPYQPQDKCTANFVSQNSFMNSQKIQNIQLNAYLSNQTVAQVQIQFQNDQEIHKIMNLQKQNTQMQIVFYTQSYNTLVWSDGSIVDDPNIDELVIHDTVLNITNNLIVNQNNNINLLLFYNINIVGLQNQVVFENIPKIIFSNITIQSITSQQQNNLLALIIFKNCSEIILNNITINNINIYNQTFFQFENISNLKISQISASDSIFSSLIQITQALQMSLKQLTIQNITNQFQSIFIATTVEQTDISYLNISKTNQNQIFNFQGCYNINLSQVFVRDAQNIILLFTSPYQNVNIYPINNVKISNFDVSNSQNIGFIIQANQSSIFNCQFKNLNQTTTNLINSKLSSIEIIECNFQNLSLSQGYQIIRLINYNNLKIEQSKFQGNLGNLMYLLNQNEGFTIVLNNLQLTDNISQQESNILVNFALKLIIQNCIFKSQISQQSGGALNIQNVAQLNIIDSNFQINQSILGNGGSLYLYQIQNLYISSCRFVENQSQNESGGALFIDQSQLKTTNSSIIKCDFQQNIAIQGLGGAIYIKNCDLNLENTNILNNRAAIGGGIYYQQMIPYIIQHYQIQLKGNIIKDNGCILYGQNIASTFRKIKFNIEKPQQFKIEESNQYQSDVVIVKNFRSGDYLVLDDIQIIDEDSYNFKYNPLLKYSQRATEIIQQTTLSINMQNKNEQMNIFGGIIVTYQNGKFSFNTSLSYIPNENSKLYIQSQTIPALYDSKGNIYLEEKQLSIIFNVEFRKCITGEVQKSFFSSIICDECPDGKYSLNINDQVCQICPSQAVECFGSQINVKNGYWKKNNQSDQILYCVNAPENCQPESNKSKFGCAQGYIGPLCEQCDFFGNVWEERYSTTFKNFNCSKCSDILVLAGFQQAIFVLLLTFYIYICNRKVINSIERDLQNYYIKMMGLIYLNNSVYKTNSTVFSKILIDHIQIISILSSISFQFPTVIQFSSNVGGNPLLIQTSMFDCFYPQEISIPKWFAKVICSMSLPFIIYFLNYIINIFLKVVYKQNTHSRYKKTTMIFFYFYFYPSIIFILIKSINCVNIGNEKYAQIDTLISCRDFSDHFIYNLVFSFPAIFMTCVAIPLFFIHKVRQNMRQNLSKIQKSSYQFIYEPYKNQFYYWEFVRLLYKTTVMISSIFLQEYLSLKTCIVNQILVLYNYIQMRVNPFAHQLHNQLENQSILISISTLNFCLVQSLISDEYYTIVFLFQLAIILLNLYFVLKLVFLTFVKPVSPNRQNRNIFQECLYKMKTLYPQIFKFIIIDSKIKFQTALKIKKLRLQLKVLNENRNERQSTMNLGQKQSQRSMIFNSQKIANQYKFQLVNQQTDYEAINTEFDNFKQAQQALTLQSRYQLSAKIKNQESPLIRQDTSDFSQISLRQSNFQFRLINFKDQHQDEIVEKQNSQTQE
ncbi:hypothetical protein ABPG74_015327 [Tetrahymena malaccensis]